MSKDLSEHHKHNVGERETHRVDPDHTDRFRDPERLEKLRPDELVEKLSIEPGDHVLDVGCGDGLFFGVMSGTVGEQGRVTGIDIEAGMVEAARDDAAAEGLDNVEVKQSDNDSIPLDEDSVDRAILVNVLHEMAYPTDTLEELARVVKPGGTLLLYDRHKEETGPEGPPIHHLVSREEALELLETAGFDVDQEFDWDEKMYSMILRKT